jgi:hypothetical protein
MAILGFSAIMPFAYGAWSLYHNRTTDARLQKVRRKHFFRGEQLQEEIEEEEKKNVKEPYKRSSYVFPRYY